MGIKPTRPRPASFERLARRLSGGAAGRSFEPGPDDVMLVSYPRSGNTWMRFLIAGLRSGRNVNFVNLENHVPDIYVSSKRHIRRLPPPRVIKSHQPYTPAYGRTIYLTRDPRDVAASYLRYLQSRGLAAPTATLADFARDFLTKGSAWDRFGTWQDHVIGWLSRAEDADFLLLRYEDLLADPKTGMAQVVRFLDLSVDPSAIQKALALASPEKLRTLERRQSRRSRSLNYYSNDTPFVGSATSGAGRQAMDPETLSSFDQQLGTVMHRLGYA